MSQPNPQLEISQILEAAHRLGVELNEAEAIQWLTAIAAARAQSDQLTVDADAGVYGFNVAMLDFDKQGLERYRRIGAIVAIPNGEGVETALSLSGSAAQSRVQLFPGDCDFFQRINISAPTRQAACQKIGEVMRAKALAKLRGPHYQFVDCRLSQYPADVVRGEQTYKKGTSIVWGPADVQAGAINCFTSDGQPRTLSWAEAARAPGWCKLDWMVAEPEHARVISVSNMLDVTWEAPDGTITPLDGFLEPYFQEVYLDASSIPLFTKLSKHISPQALDDYVEQLQREVMHYVREKPNFGKAAKRMYNIFRLTGRFQEAIFIRELFDEPAARLYQVWALLDTLEEAGPDAEKIEQAIAVDQIDRLIQAVVECAEGPNESRIVMGLLKLRDGITGRAQLGEGWIAAIEESRTHVALLVNDYFREKLYAIPPVAEYLAQFGE